MKLSQPKQDHEISGALSAGDPDHDPLRFTGPIIGPRHGFAVVNPDGTFRYVPSFGFSGTDAFSVLVDDGHGGVVEVKVTIVVEPTAITSVGIEETQTAKSTIVDTLSEIVVDGVVLDTVAAAGGLSDHSIDLTTTGIVINAVNNILQLEGHRAFGRT